MSKSQLIGIREAKAQLSRLVSEAQRGAEWTITDRGRPVAKLVPLGELDTPLAHRLARLEGWGWIEPGPAPPAPLPPPISIAADAQELLQRDRGV